MKHTLIQWIERVNRDVVLLGLGLLLAATALTGVHFERMRSVTFGPPTVEFVELAKAAAASDLALHWATVQGARAIDTGFELVDKNGGSFVALESGEFLLLVKVKQLSSALRFRGQLVDIPSNVRDEVIASINNKYPNTEGHFLPVMMVESGLGKYEAAIGFTTLALIVMGLFLIHRGAKGMEEPHRYYSLRRVVGWNDLREVLDSVDKEILDAKNRLDIGNVVLTPSWLVARGLFTLEMAELNEIVWLFKKPRTPWDILPRSVLTFYFEKGERLELTLWDRDCDRLISEIAIRVPWIVTGYNKNIEVLWISDRRAFLAELHARREKASTSSVSA